MPKTSAEDIKKRLTQGFDTDYYNSLFRLARYAFGEDIQQTGMNTQGGLYPDFPETNVTIRKKGKSKRMLNVATIALARMAYTDPEPSFPDVDMYTEEVRRQFFIERARGVNGQGDWSDEKSAALLDGHMLGIGVVKIGLKTNPKTDRQYVDIEHVPALRFLWDRRARHPGKSPWCCFVNYMPMEKAVHMFGQKDAQRGFRMLYDYGNAQPVEVCRIFEYWDIGFVEGVSKWKPTVSYIPGDLDQEPIEIAENDYGILPFAHYASYFLPGLRRPVGSIYKMMTDNDALDDIQDALLKDVRRGASVTLIDASQVNLKDAQNALAGRNESGMIRLENPNAQRGPAIQRSPSMPPDENKLQMFKIMGDRFNESSDTSELDRGNFSDIHRTATENELLVNRSSSGATWQTKQTLLFHVRLVQKTLHIAAVGDRDPLTLSVKGRQYTVNRPGEPASTIDQWLVPNPQDESGKLEFVGKVIIGDDALSVSDANQEKAQRLAQLQVLEKYVGTLIDPTWYTEELLRASGSEPSEAMMKPQEQQGDNGLGGVPSPVAPPPQGMGPGMASTPPQPPQQPQAGGIKPVPGPTTYNAYAGNQ